MQASYRQDTVEENQLVDKKRNSNQSAIWKTCKKINCFRVPEISMLEDSTHAAYKCYIFIEKSRTKKGWSRDKIMDAINLEGIPVKLDHVQKSTKKKLLKTG